MKFILNQKNTDKIIHLPVECLLNNHLDKELRESYEPLNFIDKLFLSPKFNITNSFITPSSKISNAFAVLGAILQILMHIYRFIYLSSVFKELSKGVTVTITLFINEFMYILASILHYGNSITQSKNSVLLMIKLQQAFRVLDLDKAIILNNHKFWSRISIIIMSVIYSVYTGVYVVGNVVRGQGISSILLVFPQMIFDMNVIYFALTTDLIGRMLTSWKNKMMACGEQLTNEEFGQSHEPKTIKSLYSAYTKLIAAFCLSKSVFQVSILFLVFQTFALMLITLQIIIEFGFFKFRAANMADAASQISSVAWNLKNIVLLVIMSLACKQYYEIIRDVEATCTRLVTSARDQDVRRLCKNVLRHNRACGGPLRAGGVLAVDAALPPRVLAAVLAYTVVLLQFAFLSN